MNQNGNDYVSLVRIPRKWFDVFVWSFSSLVIANVLIELFTGWFFILAHIWEAIMLGYAKLFKDKILAEGRAEGKAEKAEQKAEQKCIASCCKHKKRV